MIPADSAPGTNPEPPSLDGPLEHLGRAASQLSDWYAGPRPDDPNADWRAGYGVIDLMDSVTAALVEVRAQLLDDVRENMRSRAERLPWHPLGSPLAGPYRYFGQCSCDTGPRLPRRD